MTKKDIVTITECAPSIDSNETFRYPPCPSPPCYVSFVKFNKCFSQDPKTKFSFYKDPVVNSQKMHTHFWDPEPELAAHPPRLCGQTTSNDKALFCVEFARRLFVFNPFKAQDILFLLFIKEESFKAQYILNSKKGMKDGEKSFDMIYQDLHRC